MTTGQNSDKPHPPAVASVPENTTASINAAAGQTVRAAWGAAKETQRGQRNRVVEMLDSTDNMQQRIRVIEKRLWRSTFYLFILIAFIGLLFGYVYRSYIFESPKDWIAIGFLVVTVVAGMTGILVAWRKHMSLSRAIFETSVSIFQDTVSLAWAQTDQTEELLFKERNDVAHLAAPTNDGVDSVACDSTAGRVHEDDERGRDDD